MSLAEDLTIVIKTFDRPHLLRNLMRSLRRFYPDLPVVIVDDGRKQAFTAPPDDLVKLVPAALDIGVSAGRNLGVAHVETPFTFVMDDDFAFLPISRLEDLLRPVKELGFGICGSRMINFGTHEICYHGIFERHAGHLRMLNGHDRGTRDGLARLDYCHNVLCAPTDLLRRHPWDDRLKVHEHWDFFYRLRTAANVDVTIVPETGFAHFPVRHAGYKRFRNTRDHLEDLALRNCGLTSVKLIGETAKPAGLGKLRLSLIKRFYGAYFRLVS